MSGRQGIPLQTKRVILAHVSVCRGCCCGAVGRGRPEVPVNWMKEEWKRRSLKSAIQLTISGCLGPCDLSNVVSVSSAEGSIWLGTLREFRDYAAILEWAMASKEAGRAVPLPAELSEFEFDPFREARPAELEQPAWERLLPQRDVVEPGEATGRTA